MKSIEFGENGVLFIDDEGFVVDVHPSYLGSRTGYSTIFTPKVLERFMQMSLGDRVVFLLNTRIIDPLQLGLNFEIGQSVDEIEPESSESDELLAPAKPPTQYITPDPVVFHLNDVSGEARTKTRINWYAKVKASIPWGASIELGWSRETLRRVQSRGYDAVKDSAFPDYKDELDDWKSELKSEGRWAERRELGRMIWSAIKAAYWGVPGLLNRVQNLDWAGKLKRR